MTGGYRTIVADPPWTVKRLESPGAKGFGTGTGPLRSVAFSYPTLTVEEIAGLPVEGLAEDDAHLYLWTINAYVEQAYAVARAWGFRPSTLLTWCKAPMGLGPGGAYSITTEFILFSRRGSLPPLRRFDSTWWAWKRGQHSAKPEAFIDLVEQVSPGPYVELFARRHRLGWDVWGNESANTATMEVPA
jgi:N6-adenosine-specific RNA methylase IME4